uniref:Uncharacterized protein n=1 Tax=Anguilla anguilla TaxID=7936 RepID=A0A0E9RY66_ANGAN
MGGTHPPLAGLV